MKKAKEDAIACSRDAEESKVKHLLEYEKLKKSLEQEKLKQEEIAKDIEIKLNKLAKENNLLEIEKARIQQIEMESIENKKKSEEMTIKANKVLKECNAKELKMNEDMIKHDLFTQESQNQYNQENKKRSLLYENEKINIEKERSESKMLLESLLKRETELDLKTLSTKREIERRERKCEELEVKHRLDNMNFVSIYLY